MNKKNFPVWTLLYQNIILIIIAVIVFGCGGYAYSRIRKNETYTATKKIIVSAYIDPSADQTSSSALTNATLANLVLPTISTAFVSDEAIAIMNKYIDNYEDRDHIRGSSIGFDFSSNSLICSISYSSADKDESKKKLNYLIKGFSYWLDECDKMGVNIISTGTVSIMSVQKEASISTSSPYLRDAFIFAVSGFVLVFAFISLRYLFDNKVNSEQDIIDITGEGVLAYIEKAPK